MPDARRPCGNPSSTPQGMRRQDRSQLQLWAVGCGCPGRAETGSRVGAGCSGGGDALGLRLLSPRRSKAKEKGWKGAWAVLELLPVLRGRHPSLL